MGTTHMSTAGKLETFRQVDTSHLSGAEKAAILVMYLDESTVRDLFGSLHDSEIRQVGEAISGMARVQPELVQAIIAEFAADMSASLYLRSQGDAYLKAVFPAVLGEDRAHRLLRSIEPVSRVGFQRRFAQVQPGSLAARLEKEHPQTIAVACAVLGSELTARVLTFFELDLQVDVMLRLARLKRFPVELLEDIEALLGDAEKDQLAAMHNIDADGSKLVAETIGALQGEDKDELLAALSARDEDIAGEVSRQMFSFELLTTADAKGIQNLLKEVERKELALGLKGADQKTRQTFFDNMSERAAEYLKDDMEAMGPVRLSEVEGAQQQIIALALRLEEEGKLMFLGSGEAVVE
jgi:flagellar motor switch protein FliG